MFRPANPSSRFPAYLQNHTKENFFWQLKLAGVILLVSLIKDWYKDWKRKNHNYL